MARIFSFGKFFLNNDINLLPVNTAEGVSGATTRTVVTSSLVILMLDFVLTAIMFRGN